jgi:hypothetical protein
MNFPPGLGITDSIVNLEETFGKVVGRHKPMPPQERYAQLLRLGRGITTGRTGLPKGVHRFRKHEEANQWTLNQILLRIARK